ncbi:hypothetical protein P0E63_13710, partial [Enterococcus faecalis]
MSKAITVAFAHLMRFAVSAAHCQSRPWRNHDFSHRMPAGRYREAYREQRANSRSRSAERAQSR